MRRGVGKREKKKRESLYVGDSRPTPNLLDYRYMDIEMGKRASTEIECLSVAALLLIASLCLASVIIYLMLRSG